MITDTDNDQLNYCKIQWKNVVCPEKLEKFNESNIFQVSEIFPGVLSVFWYRYF